MAAAVESGEPASNCSKNAVMIVKINDKCRVVIAVFIIRRRFRCFVSGALTDIQQLIPEFGLLKQPTQSVSQSVVQPKHPVCLNDALLD